MGLRNGKVMGNQKTVKARMEENIHSYEELMAAVTEATSGRVKFVAEENGTLIMQLSSGFKVVVYEDNHTVNVEFKCGVVNKTVYCFNYQQAYQTIMNAETGNIQFADPVKMSSARKIFTRVTGAITFVLSIALFVAAGFIMLGVIYGGIYEGFSPFYVYLALFISSVVVFLGAIGLMYLGVKLLRRKIDNGLDKDIER